MQPHLQFATATSARDAHTRLIAHRWRFFQYVFVFAYAGILMDVVTTAIGSQVAGSVGAYEQNPLGGSLIGHFGWLGITAALTALMLLLHASLRVSYRRVSPRWIRAFNWLLLGVGGFRWLAVVTALMYIVHAPI